MEIKVKDFYESPVMEVYEVKVEGVICQSNTGGSSIPGYGENYPI